VGAKQDKRFITPKSEDASAWYTDVILQAELADYSPVRGCQVYRPYGFAIWENIKRLLNDRIIATGHQNTYYPLFIPKSLLDKEAEHVEGFNPQVAWVTHGGGKELDEWLAIRPTSEVIIGTMWAKWLTSYRDLPYLENQWANVVRWEKATRPFLRTMEFLWQEGHTAHRTEAEAREEQEKMAGQYRELAHDDLAMHVLSGLKSPSETFAGAVNSLSIEAMMPDGKALQSGTSHYLGQNFSKAYDIKYLDEDNTEKHVHTTSWGVSHRIMGGMLMVHGDDKGIVLPPKVAPIHVVIVPILGGAGGPARDAEAGTAARPTNEMVLEKAHGLAASIREQTYAGQKVSVKVDDREEFRPGYKFAHWELRGVPLRIELGPRDIAAGTAIIADRLTGAKDTAQVDFATYSWQGQSIVQRLEGLQEALYSRSRPAVEGRIFEVSSYEEFKEVMATGKGFVLAPWDGDAATEERVKNETGATTRVLLAKTPAKDVKCLFSGAPARHLAYFATSY
jgi:prolyl-tRNA synthetase